MVSIFVSIASYRDDELIPTLYDLLKNQSDINNIRYVVCLQDTKQQYNNIKTSFQNNSKIEIIFIPYKQARGACYARQTILDYYNNEDYFLQIDSHMRSCELWDVCLLNTINKLYPYKAIISCYPPSYIKNNDDYKKQKYSTLGYYTSIGLKSSLHKYYKAGKLSNTTGEPVRSFHIAAGFHFAPSEWIKEIEYPGDLYFFGEEDSIRIQSYTNGWTVYTPEKTIFWHFYTNISKDTSKKFHWKDNPEYKKKQFNLRDIKIGKKRDLKMYIDEIYQYTNEYRKLRVDKKKFNVDTINKIVCILYHFDNVIYKLEITDNESLDKESDIINLKYKMLQLYLATRYKLIIYGYSNKTSKEIKTEYCYDFLMK